MHPKFDLIEVQTHDLQIMGSAFHAPEMLVLTTDPPGTTEVAMPEDEDQKLHALSFICMYRYICGGLTWLSGLEVLGFDPWHQLCIEVLGKLHIPCSLKPPSCKG